MNEVLMPNRLQFYLIDRCFCASRPVRREAQSVSTNNPMYRLLVFGRPPMVRSVPLPPTVTVPPMQDRSATPVPDLMPGANRRGFR